MTPDELRSLADEATPVPWTLEDEPPADLMSGHTTVAGYVSAPNARLIALAPDLARLCAELGEALEWQLRWVPKDVRRAPAHVDAFAVLAKLAELNNGAEASPTPERT